jgi:hypothetical protein
VSEDVTAAHCENEQEFVGVLGNGVSTGCNLFSPVGKL